MNKLLQEYCNILKSFNISFFYSPITKLDQFKDVYVKRDDLLFLKCSKQRGIAYSIFYSLKFLNQTKFVLSSSGNSAIVAIYIALNTTKITELIIFLSKTISAKKLNKLMLINNLINDPEFPTKKFLSKENILYKNISVYFSEYPRREIFKMLSKGYTSLNTSDNEYAVFGFKTLGFEIFEQVNYYNLNIQEIFIPASSGATVLGLFEGLNEKRFLPKINIIQTTHAFALIKPFFQKVKFEESHPADSIVDFVGKKRSKILEILKITKGKPFIIDSIETKNAYNHLKLLNINCSFDSALTFAAFLKAGAPEKSLLIFTG